MKLGIIGAGELGGAVGRAWAKAGHDVILSSRHPGRLQAGAGQRVADIATCIDEAEVVLLATPYRALPDLGRRYAAALAGKVVLDATNPELGDRGELAQTAHREGMAETTQVHLPGARLVRAFSSINATSIDANSAALGSDGSGLPPEERLAVPVAGDDDEAVALACKLVRDAGCEPVVTGDLASARRFQWGNPGCLVNDNAAGLRRAMGLSSPDIGQGPTPLADPNFVPPSNAMLNQRKEDDMKQLSAAILGATLLVTGANAQTRIAPDAVYQVSPALGENTDKVLFGQMWERDNLLAKRDRSLITIAALIASGKSAQLSGHIGRGLDNGLTPQEIGETINQLAYYSGWPNAVSAAEVTKQVFDERGIGPIQNSDGARITLEPQAEAARQKTVAETTEPLAPGLAEFTNSALFGDLWLRPDLKPRDRSLVTVAALIAMGQPEQLGFHLNYAMDNGLTREEAGEVVSHLAFYAGFPRAYSAVPMLRQIFEARQGK